MLFNSGLTGRRVADANFRLRFLLIFFGGIVAAGSILYWRSQLLLSQDYVDFPQDKVHHHPSQLKAPTSASAQRLEKELNNDQGQ